MTKSLVAFVICFAQLTTGTAVFAKSVTASKDIRSKISVLARLQDLNPHLAHREGYAWPLKIESILRNEYSFFRGTADLFAEEVKRHEGQWIDATLPPVLLHGDVHLGNIGTYQGTGAPGKTIQFGLVDFDEAVVGPFEYDLLRGATSLRFAVAEENLKLSDNFLHSAVVAMCNAYADGLNDPPADESLAARFPVVSKHFRKARKASLRKYVAKFTEGSPLRFRSVRMKKGTLSDIMAPVNGSTRSSVVDAMWRHLEHGVDEQTRRRYRFKTKDDVATGILDVASWVRVGSSGSQGLTKYLVLLDRPLVDSDDPVILQLKEEPIPAATRGKFVLSEPSVDRAAEVASASLQINPNRPWLVGFTTMDQQAFLVKTKDPWGKELSSSDLDSPDSVRRMAELIGTLLGRSHQLGWDRATPNWSLEKTVASVRNRAEVLARASATLQMTLHTAYTQLHADPDAQVLVDRAQSMKRGRH